MISHKVQVQKSAQKYALDLQKLAGRYKEGNIYPSLRGSGVISHKVQVQKSALKDALLAMLKNRAEGGSGVISHMVQVQKSALKYALPLEC